MPLIFQRQYIPFSFKNKDILYRLWRTVLCFHQRDLWRNKKNHSTLEYIAEN